MNTNSEKMLQALSEWRLNASTAISSTGSKEDPADVLAELGEELLALGFLEEETNL